MCGYRTERERKKASRKASRSRGGGVKQQDIRSVEQERKEIMKEGGGRGGFERGRDPVKYEGAS